MMFDIEPMQTTDTAILQRHAGVWLLNVMLPQM